MSGRVLTCVYCGHEYPQDTPSHGSEVLTAHIRVCAKHPMRAVEAALKIAMEGLEEIYKTSMDHRAVDAANEALSRVEDTIAAAGLR